MTLNEGSRHGEQQRDVSVKKDIPINRGWRMLFTSARKQNDGKKTNKMADESNVNSEIQRADRRRVLIKRRMCLSEWLKWFCTQSI